MKDKKMEIELLLAQRSQLVDALSKTNSTFQKILLAIFTALVSLLAAGHFFTSNLTEHQIAVIVLFLIQLIILMILLIGIILIVGNEQRAYISAIDEYLYSSYGITALFYQGNLSREHTIGRKSFFSIMTMSMGILVAVLIVWLIFEFRVWTYVVVNAIYVTLVLLEITLFAIMLVYNMHNKRKMPKAYHECLNYLNRDMPSKTGNKPDRKTQKQNSRKRK